MNLFGPVPFWNKQTLCFSNFSRSHEMKRRTTRPFHWKWFNQSLILRDSHYACMNVSRQHEQTNKLELTVCLLNYFCVFPVPRSFRGVGLIVEVLDQAIYTTRIFALDPYISGHPDSGFKAMGTQEIDPVNQSGLKLGWDWFLSCQLPWICHQRFPCIQASKVIFLEALWLQRCLTKPSNTLGGLVEGFWPLWSLQGLE